MAFVNSSNLKQATTQAGNTSRKAMVILAFYEKKNGRKEEKMKRGIVILGRT